MWSSVCCLDDDHLISWTQSSTGGDTAVRYSLRPFQGSQQYKIHLLIFSGLAGSCFTQRAYYILVLDGMSPSPSRAFCSAGLHLGIIIIHCDQHRHCLDMWIRIRSCRAGRTPHWSRVSKLFGQPLPAKSVYTLLVLPSIQSTYYIHSQY